VVGEAIERERRYLDRIIDVVWSICEESWWGVPAHLVMQGAKPGLPDPDDPLVELMAAETAATLGWTLRLVGGELEDVAPRIARRSAPKCDAGFWTPSRHATTSGGWGSPMSGGWDAGAARGS
jgi:hypothetical protein